MCGRGSKHKMVEAWKKGSSTILHFTPQCPLVSSHKHDENSYGTLHSLKKSCTRNWHQSCTHNFSCVESPIYYSGKTIEEGILFLTFMWVSVDTEATWYQKSEETRFVTEISFSLLRWKRFGEWNFISETHIWCEQLPFLCNSFVFKRCCFSS